MAVSSLAMPTYKWLYMYHAVARNNSQYYNNAIHDLRGKQSISIVQSRQIGGKIVRSRQKQERITESDNIAQKLGMKTKMFEEN